MTQDRNALFDYAKGIGILLVVYGHVARGVFNAGLPIDVPSYTLIDSILYSFHMPLFFFLSGIFFLGSLQKRGYLGLMRSKLDTIFYPYMLWSLIQGGVEIVLSRYTTHPVTPDQILSLLWKPHDQFWFLYVLFGVFLFAGLVYQRSTWPWTTGILVLAIVLYLTGYSPADIYMLNAFPGWFVFFALGVSGAFLFKWIEPPRYALLIASVSCFILGLWAFHAFPDLASPHSAYTLLLAILGIAFVITLSQRLAQWNLPWLAYIGRHSMEIYLVHTLAASGARMGLQKVLHVTDANVHLAAGTLFGIGIPIMVVLIARHWRLTWFFSPPNLLRQSSKNY